MWMTTGKIICHLPLPERLLFIPTRPVVSSAHLTTLWQDCPQSQTNTTCRSSGMQVEKIIPVMPVDRFPHRKRGRRLMEPSPEYPVTSSCSFYAILPCTCGFGTGLVKTLREVAPSIWLWKISHPGWLKTFWCSLVGEQAPLVCK